MPLRGGSTFENCHRVADAPVLQNSFLVAVHDVSPAFASEISVLTAALESRIGHQFSQAVIPKFPGTHWKEQFLESLRGFGGDLWLHGWHHRSSRKSLRSWLARGADEFDRLPPEARREKLRLGANFFTCEFGRIPEAFLAPCWRVGQLTLGELQRIGVECLVGYRKIWLTDARVLSVCTVNRDWGWPGCNCLLGAWSSRQARRVNSRLPVLVFHPMDVRRGLLSAGLRDLERWLQAGCKPILLGAHGN